MKLTRLPLVGSVIESGADDSVFDALLLSSPFVLILIAIFGRTLVTVCLAGVYLILFALYLLYNGLQ
ncbi:hypothetical protein [Halomarina litorea]|uniref:hypothetical protein n=1 Tax=Halomarina litorea TaxID=2961595 RepID=UPI0020C515BF|nr:hypothetical protein [Halomarina sp. BCD28]